mmetsp:Transcript_21391/g.61914  ORF Transcript_21391/g.61914 Transcript_21391/m.61914 type:complete len:207 (+) Transcript_21391:344-964(+)
MASNGVPSGDMPCSKAFFSGCHCTAYQGRPSLPSIVLTKEGPPGPELVERMSNVSCNACDRRQCSGETPRWWLLKAVPGARVSASRTEAGALPKSREVAAAGSSRRGRLMLKVRRPACSASSSAYETIHSKPRQMPQTGRLSPGTPARCCALERSSSRRATGGGGESPPPLKRMPFSERDSISTSALLAWLLIGATRPPAASMNRT